jgi:hypothetical protein
MRQLTSINGAIIRAVRYGLPAVLILAGVVVLLVADDSGRYDLLNLLFRLGVSGDRTRDDEERAREFFSQHGYWPDEHPDHRHR